MPGGSIIPPVKILIVEDQTLFRDLLANECSLAIPSAAIRSAGSVKELLDACRADPPEIILLDIVLPDGDALDFLGDVLACAPSARIVLLSSHIDEFTVHRALKAEVHGILDKIEQPARTLREVISTVAGGKRFLSPAVIRMKASVRADPLAFDKILTRREQDVLRLVGDGLTNDAIAKRLSITAATAKTHRIRIMAKLGMHSTHELVRYAIEKGFTRLPERAAKTGL